MTYESLKAFCNSLTPEQLQQEVYLAQVDDAAIKVESADISTEDMYFDHTDIFGNLEQVKEDYPDTWQDIVDELTVCPAGTVMLVNE